MRVHYIILYDNEKIFGMSMSLCTHAMLPFAMQDIFLLPPYTWPTFPPYPSDLDKTVRKGSSKNVHKVFQTRLTNIFPFATPVVVDFFPGRADLDE